jgi:hypothetical protein
MAVFSYDEFYGAVSFPGRQIIAPVISYILITKIAHTMT